MCYFCWIVGCGIVFDGFEVFVFVYSDLDYVGDFRKVKSMCSYLFVINGGIVVWKLKL